jgi:hypothetical protein
MSENATLAENPVIYQTRVLIKDALKQELKAP